MGAPTAIPSLHFKAMRVNFTTGFNVYLGKYIIMQNASRRLLGAYRANMQVHQGKLLPETLTAKHRPESVYVSTSIIPKAACLITLLLTRRILSSKEPVKMVCAKCQKNLKKTELATPGVKRKNEIYLGSPTVDKSKTGSSSSTTLGGSGIGKSKLLSKSAKNPYAAYSSSCETCKVKVAQGYKLCHRCAYKASNGTCRAPFDSERSKIESLSSLRHVWKKPDQVDRKWAGDTGSKVLGEMNIGRRRHDRSLRTISRRQGSEDES